MNPTTTTHKYLLDLRASHQEAPFILTGDQGARTGRDLQLLWVTPVSPSAGGLWAGSPLSISQHHAL